MVFFSSGISVVLFDTQGSLSIASVESLSLVIIGLIRDLFVSCDYLLIGKDTFTLTKCLKTLQKPVQQPVLYYLPFRCTFVVGFQCFLCLFFCGLLAMWPLVYLSILLLL